MFTCSGKGGCLPAVTGLVPSSEAAGVRHSAPAEREG